MINFNKLTKALLGASALTAFTAISAHAAGTAAGTQVDNTFTLDYKVNSIDQTQVNNTGTPTSFNVDRLVDLTVAADQPTVEVTPGAVDQELTFTVTNTGNDTQYYALSIVDEGSDDFSATDNATIYYSLDNGTTVTAYVAGSPPVLAADAEMEVYIRSDIPLTTTNAQTDNWILVADTTDSSGTPVTADTDGNDLAATENVLADGAGTSEENANEGDHSASSQYVVAAANLSGSKAVNVISTDGTGCSPAPTSPSTATTTEYPVPGACVEYVITVANGAGGAVADNISVSDAVPATLGSLEAAQSGFSDTGANAAAVSITGNTVSFVNGQLAAGETGYVIIRAIVQ